MILRDLELGAIQAHLLYHAAQHPIYGSWMAQELVRHGFVISYGTLYPMLHRLQTEGLLDCREQREGSQLRKYYTATPSGRAELEQVKHLIRELYQEVVEQAEGTHLEDASAQAASKGENPC